MILRAVHTPHENRERWRRTGAHDTDDRIAYAIELAHEHDDAGNTETAALLRDLAEDLRVTDAALSTETSAAEERDAEIDALAPWAIDGESSETIARLMFRAGWIGANESVGDALARIVDALETAPLHTRALVLAR